MPVTIELANSHQLRTQENDSSLLQLPVIKIKPTENSNFPHISRIDISASGTPEELAEQIQSSYKSVNFGPDNLLKLSTPQQLKQTNCQWKKPLPADVNCTLQITVEYFDSDAMGIPKVGASKEAKSECSLWTPPVEKPSEKDTGINGLKEVPKVDSKVEPSVVTNQQIDDSKKPVWLAIDFGTSNSTITLYEPKRIVEPDPWFSEPEMQLRTRLDEWLTQRPGDDLSGVSRAAWEKEWEKFLSQLHENSPETKQFQNLQGERLLEAIRQLEITLNLRQTWFRRAASKRLYQIYHEVFSVPLLEWQSLLAVELDRTRRLSEIPSELEVINLEPSLPEDNPEKLKVEMGHPAKQHRLDAINKGEEIGGKFFHSPKRYLGLDHRSVKVTLNGKEDTIPVNVLIKAAYAHLIDLTYNYRQRNPGKCTQGKFFRAVVTYPTIASPFVRSEIEDLVKKLGIDDVRLDYDEAVSVAIFFLWKEFGGDFNIGIESFKTRCRRDGYKWWQNVLVLDIGGGTTDLALIRLTLEEIDPFEAGEDRGDGGRYYKLTPEVLGSSGHLQLGGELITLGLFRLLKASIADCLLTAVTEEHLAKDVLKLQLEELSPPFLNNGKFTKGALLACVDTEIRGGDAYGDALKDAEKVLPTRWKNSSSRLQTFYDLWQYAEEAKLKLGQKRQKDVAEPIFVLDGQKIAELLQQNDIQLPSELIDSLSVRLTVEQFEKAAAPYVREAIGIAHGLVENAFKKQLSTANNSSKTNDSPDSPDRLDWIILSGKTCNLDLVERELYRVFSKSEYFVWNQERITREPQYFKLATSAGACLAEKLRQLSFAPREAIDLLRKGANQLYIDVKNLSYSLPCSFEREVIGTATKPIFHTRQKLYQLQAGDGMAKCRSDWQGIQLTNMIKRRDFEGKNPQNWGSYNGDALMKVLGMNEDDFKDQIKVQFEINQNLEIDLLLCRGNPHYLIPPETPYLDAAEAIETPALISPEGKVVCDIAVNVLESVNAGQTDAYKRVFKAEKDYSKSLSVFKDDDGAAMREQGMGLVAELPPFPSSGKHTFYFKLPDQNSKQWELIGELSRPKMETNYPCKYYVSLNEKGILRVHAFEIPYWMSPNLESLKQEGCVVRRSLDSVPNQEEEDRNPFSGEH